MTTPNELARIEAQLRAAFVGPAWHGPAVLDALRGVGAAQATARPIADAHTIWELVLHLGGAYALVLRRLRGDSRQLSAEEDWPRTPEPTEANWRAAIAELSAQNEAMRAAVRNFDAARLALPIISESPYDAFTQFIGLTQHDLYHAGQIALLRRALGMGAVPAEG